MVDVTSYPTASTTAGTNASIAGISILGSGLVSTADDSFRASMALAAKFYADFGGVNTVGGTASAITVTTPTTYAAYATGMRLRFIPASNSTGATTINVDGVGAKALRKINASGVDVALSASDLIAGSGVDIIYSATANSAAGAWIVAGTSGSSVGLVAIGSQDVISSGVASFAKTGLDSTYDEYEYHFQGFVPASASTLQLRTSTNGGSSYDSGASDYNRGAVSSTSTTTTTTTINGASSIQLNPTTVLPGTSTDTCAGVIKFYRPSEAARWFMVSWEMHYTNQGSGTMIIVRGAGSRNTAADVDAFQLTMASGNINAMFGQLYGVAK